MLKRFRKLAMVGLLAGLLAMPLQQAPPSNAAQLDLGPGFTSSWDYELRSFRLPNGLLVYCIDFTWGRPMDNQPLNFTVTTSIPARGEAIPGPTTKAVSATDVARMNFILSKYGQTNDNVQAAAVRSAMMYYTLAGVGNNTTYINQLIGSLNATAAERNQVTTRWQQMVVEAAGAPIGSVGTGFLDFDVLGSTYEGTVTVLPPAGIPAGTTGVIELENGIFVDSGSNIMTDAVSGVAYDVIGVPPTGNPPYKINGHATFAVPEGYGTGNAIHLLTSQAGRQRVVYAGPGISTYEAHALDPFNRATTFAPVLETTVANSFIQQGEYPTDLLTFGVGEVTDPNTGEVFVNPWYEFLPGAYELITATGTLYGPSAVQFTQSSTVPAGVPVHQTATVTTTEADGPNTVYEVTGTEPIEEPGYYTWVWEIDVADQSLVALDFLPADYYFAHDFGIAEETHLSPFEIAISTQLATHEVLMGESTIDRVTIDLVDGPWLSDHAGVNHEVELIGSIYYSETEPVQSSEPPASAELLDIVDLTVSGETTRQITVTAPHRFGWVTVQFCTVTGQRYVVPVCDDYGIPAETFRILGPEVSSLATAEAAPGSWISDDVIVTGPLPSGGLNLTVEAFLQEEGFTAAVCEDSNRIFTSDTMLVSTAGTYTSNEYQVDPDLPLSKGEERVIYFIETATTTDGTLIHRGDCGVENERTIVRLPDVSSEALAIQMLGGEIGDELIVSGIMPPGSTATVRAYLQDDPNNAVCVDDNMVYESSPVTLEEGMHDQSRIELGRFTPDQIGTYYWVETVINDAGRVLHVGECGAPTEISEVTATPPIPEVGGVSIWHIAAGSMLAAFGVWLIIWRRPRKA